MKAADVELSHPDKLLFPDEKLSKRDLAEYYERIAERMLPFMEGRPLTLRCFPDGIAEDGFFNKNAPGHFPDFIRRIRVPTKASDKSDACMSTADESADLVYFAGQNAVELHAALATEDDLNRPDQMIFDFDPSDGDFSKVRKVALSFQELLDSSDIPVFWKTTGSRGLHAHLPLKPKTDFDTVRDWAKVLAERLCERSPKLTTLQSRKDRRGGKVFIDYLRNAYGQTAIVPYGVRAREGAPIATPIRVDELNDASLAPDRYRLRTIFKRIGQIEDPWANFNRHRIESLESRL